MDTNKALSLLGPYNPYVLLWFGIISTAQSFPSVFSTMAFLFAQMKPRNFHCKLEHNSTLLPKEYIGGKLRDSQCHQFANATDNTSTLVPCQNGYTYESIVDTSVVTDWDLVCDMDILNSVATSSFFLASLVGAVICGTLADRFGRRPTFLGLLSVMFVLIGVTSVAPNIYVYTLIRLLTGIAQQGVYVTGYCLMVELFPMHLRTIPGLLNQYFWTLGTFAMVLIAFYIRQWRYFYISLALPLLLFLPLFCFLPESIVWLVSKGHVDKAKIVLQKAANTIKNSNKLDVDAFDLLGKLNSKEGVINGILDELEDTDSKSPKYTILTLFTHRVLRRFILINMFIWPTTSISDYATQVKPMDLGDPYVNFVLTSVVEIPAYIIILPLIKRFGRKNLLCTMYLMTSVFLVIGFLCNLYITSSQWPTITVLLICRLIVAIIFAVIVLYASELFPTPLRSVAVGVCTGMARIGVCSAPFLFDLEKWSVAIPWIILISMCFTAAVLTHFLAETGHRTLPDTVEEIEKWVENETFLPCKRTDTKKESADSIGNMFD